MKKLAKLIVLFALTVLMCGALTACSDGSVVNTTLTLNNDLSGSRVMDVVISESVFNEYFSGSIDDLYKLVDKNCPSVLEFTHPVDGTMELVFTLNFNDPHEYQDAITSLYPDGTTTLAVPDSLWGTGFSVNEDFTSLDLLSWLPDLLVEEELVPESNKSRIIKDGNTELYFNNESYYANSYISVDKLDYIYIQGIYVLTGFNSMDNVDRTFDFRIEKNSAEQKKSEIDAFFNDFAGSGAEVTATEDDYSYIYTVTKKNLDAAGLDAFGDLVFGNWDASLSPVPESDLALFAFGDELKETVDYSAFIVNNNGLQVNYFISIPEDLMIGSDPNYGYRRDEVTPSDEFPGYTHWGYNYYYLGDEPEARSYFAVKSYSLKDIATKTSVKGKDSFAEEFVFAFEEAPLDTEKTAIEDRMRAKFEAEENAITVEGSTDEAGVYAVKASFTGNVDEMQTRLEKVTGHSATFTYGEKYNTMKLNYGKALCEYFYLNEFGNSDITVTHELDMGAFTKITASSNESDEIKGSKLTTTAEGKVDVEVIAEAFNIFAVIVYVLIVLAASFIILAVVRSGVIKELQEAAAARKAAARKAQAAASVAPVSPAPAAPVAEKPAFCEKCGAPRDPDAAVCTQCGFRFED